MKDKKIIELLQSGKIEKAFIRLYKISSKVKPILKKYGATKDVLDDIFQDALVVLYQKLQQSNFKIETSIESYIINTCKYIFLKAKRDIVETKELTDLMNEETDVEIFFLEDKKIEQAQKALQQIGEKCREILISFYIHKKSMVEIAKQFSFTSENAAKTQKYKCLEQARKNYNQILNF